MSFALYIAREQVRRREWESVRKTPGRWAFLRRLYDELTPEILVGKRRSPYVIDWDMTPIEQDLWCSIRFLDLPFWPQYPVGGYFVDFGDPVMRIALECDGAKYHDAQRDAERDVLIGELGWKVFRFPGWRCVRGGGDEKSAHARLVVALSQFYPQVRRNEAAEESD